MSDQITTRLRQIATLLEGTNVKECSHDTQEVMSLLIKLNIGYIRFDNNNNNAIFMTPN